MGRNKAIRKEVYTTNSYGDIRILEDYDARWCKVQFVNTGHTKDAQWANVRSGKIADPTVEYHPERVELHERGESNRCGPFTIIWKEGKKCLAQFDNTGFTKEANIDNARAGKITDPYAPTVYGHGYVGEYDRKIPYAKRANQLWKNMLKRCYCEADTRGYYGRVTVDERWLCFANFLEDLPKLDNFDKWLHGHQKGAVKYNLDKDLEVGGNKVYSREVCGFVSEFDNKSAGGKNRHR